MRLEDGMKLTHGELADWFGIAPHTLSNYKNKYLDILGYYADYYVEGTGVVLIKVYEDVYQRDKAIVYKIAHKIEDKGYQNFEEYRRENLWTGKDQDVEKAFELVERKNQRIKELEKKDYGVYSERDRLEREEMERAIQIEDGVKRRKDARIFESDKKRSNYRLKEQE